MPAAPARGATAARMYTGAACEAKPTDSVHPCLHTLAASDLTSSLAAVRSLRPRAYPQQPLPQLAQRCRRRIPLRVAGLVRPLPVAVRALPSRVGAELLLLPELHAVLLPPHPPRSPSAQAGRGSRQKEPRKKEAREEKWGSEREGGQQEREGREEGTEAHQFLEWRGAEPSARAGRRIGAVHADELRDAGGVRGVRTVAVRSGGRQ